MVIVLARFSRWRATQLLEINFVQVWLVQLQQHHWLVIIVLYQALNDFVFNFEFHP